MNAIRIGPEDFLRATVVTTKRGIAERIRTLASTPGAEDRGATKPPPGLTSVRDAAARRGRALPDEGQQREHLASSGVDPGPEAAAPASGEEKT